MPSPLDVPLPSAASANWQAPTCAHIHGGEATVKIPGSKSLTNRFLLLAALAQSESVVRAPLISRDTRLMMGALEALGASFEIQVSDSGEVELVRVTPLNPAAGEVRASIDTGLAGNVMRFVPPVAALFSGEISFDGDAHARKRPMGPVIQALRDLGVTVDDGATGALPFTLRPSGKISATHVVIDSSGSSQFLSGLLMAGARFQQGLTIVHEGTSIPSMPHIEMTLEVLRFVGVEVQQLSPTRWFVPPTDFAGFDVVVEPDLSNAGPFLAAATLLGSSVTVPHWPLHTTQGGDLWREILPRFGAEVSLSEQGLTVRGPQRDAGAQLPGLDYDLAVAGELAPTLAALCALAGEPSKIRGIAHLRGHETNRLKALTTEFNRLGGVCEETSDGIRLLAPVHHGGLFHTYDDHRMATAGAIVGLIVPDVVVENIGTTAKTLPQFQHLWETMVHDLTETQQHGA